MVFIAESPLGGPSSPSAPSRGGTSPIGTSSPNTSATAATNSSYAQGAFASGINDQGTNTEYTVQDTDYQGIIEFDGSSPVTITLNQAVAENFTCTILNLGTGAITLSPNGGLLVNGQTSVTFASGVGCQVFFADGAWTANAGATYIPIIPDNTPAVPHEWINSYNASTGAFGQSQPAFTDISGNLATSQLPANVPVVSFGAGAPSGSSTEGYIYFNISASPWAGYVYHSGAWNAFS